MGLNFADENEAANFQRAVEDKLNERRLRRERRMASKRQSQNGAQISAQVPQAPSMPPMPAAPQPVMQQVHVPAHVYYNRYVHSVKIMEFYSHKYFFLKFVLGLKMVKRRKKENSEKKILVYLLISNTSVTWVGIQIVVLI